MFNGLKQKILENSDSFNYYKNAYVSLKEEIERNNKEIDEVKKELQHVKQYNNRISTSNYKLLKTLFFDYELTPKPLLEKIFTLDLEILDFVDNVSKKHDLNYWLDYGTLLGAVRHENFIPWDDDLDLAMMRKDFDKFQNIVLSEIEEHGLKGKLNLYVNYVTSKNFMVSFIQIKFEKNNQRLGYLDIFPYDFLNDESIDNIVYSKHRETFYLELFENKNIKDVLNNFYNDISCSYDDGKYIIPGPETPTGQNELYNFRKIPKDDVFPIKTIKFNNKIYSSPNNVDNYLKSIYGDYMQMPRVVRHHAFCDELRKIENIEEYLDEAIDSLIKANNSF